MSISIKNVYDPPPNQAPSANNDVATYTNGSTTPLEIYVLTNDSDVNNNIDPSTVTITQGSQHGSMATISVNPATGAVSYFLNTILTSDDTLKYTVQDTNGVLSNEATITVTPL